jgi:hypothetical protein
MTQTGLVPEMPELGVVHTFRLTVVAEEVGMSKKQRTAGEMIALVAILFT